MPEVEINPMPIWLIVDALNLSSNGPYCICCTFLISQVLLIQEYGSPAQSHWYKVSIIAETQSKTSALELSGTSRIS